MSFHRLLPSISFLKSDRRVSAGSPHPLGATWDGRGTNFALFSANAEKVELCLFDKSGRNEIERIALPERTEDVWHGYLPTCSARPALRLSRAWALRAGSRTPLQPAQAADRSLQQAARRAFHLDRRAPRLSRRTQARGPVVRPPRQRARDVQVGGGRPSRTPGATTAIRTCRGKTPSSTRRTSKA